MDHHIVEVAGEGEGRTGGCLVCFGPVDTQFLPELGRSCFLSEMEAYVHPLEEAQVWGWGGPRASTPGHFLPCQLWAAFWGSIKIQFDK